jgi:hypothetical protein
MKMRFPCILLVLAVASACVMSNVAPHGMAQTSLTVTNAASKTQPIQKQSMASASVLKVRENPPAPKPEPVKISELSLPPTAPSSDAGSCTAAVNPHGTGCMAADDNGLFEGPSYMWDGKHVLMPVEFAGAPTGGIYSGNQVIAIKTDGTLFPNGDAWKCLTCGVPAENQKGANRAPGRGAGWIAPGGGFNFLAKPDPKEPTFVLVDHPQAFPDGKRIIAGTNVVECGQFKLTDAACTPDRIHIYPMYWSTKADGSGPTASMRELRLNPDGVHLGFNSFAMLGEAAGMATLVFNPAPKTGTLVPRYDLERVTLFYNPSPEFAMFIPDPKKPGYLLHNTFGAAGEWRGWSSDGKSYYVVSYVESGNYDLFRVDVATGQATRITNDPSYTDPMKSSPDDKWFVAMDARTTPERHMWYAGMQGVPPLTDMVDGLMGAFAWRNANFRYFEPILIDSYGDRGNYHGQQLNAGSGTPGSPSDPNWNGRADPTWSPDGTSVVYWQAQLTAPACGGANQGRCPASTEPGGRRTRLMIAHLTSRKPLHLAPPKTISDSVPWAWAYTPGAKPPAGQGAGIKPGKYILLGKVSGRADVELRGGASMFGMSGVFVTYSEFSDDGLHIINGTESAERVAGAGGGMMAMMGKMVVKCNLKLSGIQTGTKITGEGGYTPGLFGQKSNGTMTTTIDGKVYSSPPPGS